MKTIFVDGYNVINSWPNLKLDKNVSFEGARQNLVNKLHNYSVFEDCNICIVFDAYKVQGSIEKKEFVSKNISIVFTKDGETADAYIERKVNELGRKSEIVVVTSDNLEQQTVFQRGAVRMSTLEFYAEILKVEKRMKRNFHKIEEGKRNPLGDNIPNDVFEELEKIRRGF